MNTGLAITLIILALIVGLVGGFFISRKYMMDYFEKNPPIDENMLRMMMLQMGQKPSERKINQMMSQMKAQNKKNPKNKNKK
ncbi:YneF family protein [Marinilactibacillus sp. Marseille-P9653]|uniref:YneF family protein n=1 Tax=Marinilactibacillus sp. Marseille-P9653 TaxID=2866583 RepID=UPI001CE42294|nr:YneF family protein [Marinilactibacillus sp. Marseille-P9653]